jgi:hypothetical protein
MESAQSIREHSAGEEVHLFYFRFIQMPATKQVTHKGIPCEQIKEPHSINFSKTSAFSSAFDLHCPEFD